MVKIDLSRRWRHEPQQCCPVARAGARISQPPRRGGRGLVRHGHRRQEAVRPCARDGPARAPWSSPSTTRPRPSCSRWTSSTPSPGRPSTLDSLSADFDAMLARMQTPRAWRDAGGVRGVAEGARPGRRDRRAQAWLMSSRPLHLRPGRHQRRRQEQPRRRHVPGRRRGYFNPDQAAQPVRAAIPAPARPTPTAPRGRRASGCWSARLPSG